MSHNWFAKTVPQSVIDRHVGTDASFLDRYRYLAHLAASTSQAAVMEFVPHVMDRTSDTRMLRAALDHLRRSDGDAPGPNGLTYCDFRENESRHLLRELSTAIKEETYQPGPTRLVPVDKGAGRGKRTIFVANIEDRIVDRTTVESIQPLLDPTFDPRSFGGRPGRGAHDALARAERLMVTERRYVWITEDLRNAFPSVPRSRFLDVFRQRLPDHRLCEFITKLIGGAKGRGLRQGSPLSPLLTNLYFDHFVDRPWRRRHPTVPLLRYIDDLLLLCGPNDDVPGLYADLKQLAQAAGMALKGTYPASIHHLQAGGHARWLGYVLSLGSDGFNMRLEDDWPQGLQEALELAQDEADSALRVNEIVRGLVNYLGPCMPSMNPADTYREIVRVAHTGGFDQLDTFGIFAGQWRAAYERWLQLRERVAQRPETEGPCAIPEFTPAKAASRRQQVIGEKIGSVKEFVLYTDGSCLPNKTGGWAFILKAKESPRRAMFSDGLRRTTNNRAELLAVIRGLESLSRPSTVLLRTDSRYVADGITDGLMRWLARAGGIKNRDLWLQLASLLKVHTVRCEWLRGHAGHHLNELCHDRALKAAENMPIPSPT